MKNLRKGMQQLVKGEARMSSHRRVMDILQGERDYVDLPDPIKEWEEFNSYLREKNLVFCENEYWILIKNSYIDDQHVLFCKLPFSSVYEINNDMMKAMLDILGPYGCYHWYINACKDRSVPNRLHIHIKL